MTDKKQRAHTFFVTDFEYYPRCMKRKELKHERFWGADGNRKWAIFIFNLPSLNHIHIAKYLFSVRD